MTRPAAGLIAALAAGEGIVCVVGAGGKKTLMRRLALAHPGPVGYSATTRIPPPPRGFGDLRLIVGDDDPARIAQSAQGCRIVVFTGPPIGGGRLDGLAPERIAGIHDAAGFAATYVKADGARNRLIKAPGPDEPMLVPGCTVLLVVSARAVGRVLDGKVAHRPERVAQLAGAGPGRPIEAAHVARLIVAESRALAAEGGGVVVPVVNMADDAALEAVARDIARLALEAGVPGGRVVLTSLTAESPLIGVVS